MVFHKTPGIVDDFINRVSEAIESEKDREEIVQAFARALDEWAANPPSYEDWKPKFEADIKRLYVGFPGMVPPALQ